MVVFFISGIYFDRVTSENLIKKIIYFESPFFIFNQKYKSILAIKTGKIMSI